MKSYSYLIDVSGEIVSSVQILDFQSKLHLCLKVDILLAFEEYFQVLPQPKAVHS